MCTPRIHRCGVRLSSRRFVWRKLTFWCASSTYFKSVLPYHSSRCFTESNVTRRKGNVFNYAVSVPWRKVRANEEVLLAWEMNGKPLPKIHGGPLRVVVTGYIGARSCKWVYKINALPEPSMGPVQQQEYLYYNQQVRSLTNAQGQRHSKALLWSDRQVQYQVFERFLDPGHARLVRQSRPIMEPANILITIGAPSCTRSIEALSSTKGRWSCLDGLTAATATGRRE
jgi:hypothetical protein